MILHNPYTNSNIDYPLNLSSKNIVLDYYIEHYTFFCPAHTTWCVLHLLDGDTIYLPYGEKNKRDIYIVTSYYLNKEVAFPYGVYTMKYATFMHENKIQLPN